MEKDLSAEKPENPVRVLVADCYKSNLVLMGRILCNFNCEYDFAKSGNEVLVKLELGDFDLVFLECSLPGMEGYTAVRKIRKSAKNNGLKIICTASYLTKKRFGSRCEKCVVNGFLDRPLGMWKIREVLKDNFSEVFDE